MPVANITVDTTKRLGSELRQGINQARAALEQLRELKAIADQHTDGSSYTQVETQFGVPSGQGQNTYNLLAGALARIDHADMTQFLDRMG